MSDKMRTIYDHNVSYLTGYFAQPRLDKTFVKPEVWSWTQTRYGNWSAIAPTGATQVFEPTEQLLPVSRNKRTLETILEAGEWDWIAHNITPGNYVVILCEKPDGYSLRLPNINKRVWVVKVSKFKIKSNMLHGKFYGNKAKSITEPLTHQKKDKIQISDHMIMAIYDDDDEFSLDFENIEEVEHYVRKSQLRLG